MLRDPIVYPEPHVFRPERFLESEKGPAVQRDPAKIAFGFGRRYSSQFPLGLVLTKLRLFLIDSARADISLKTP